MGAVAASAAAAAGAAPPDPQTPSSERNIPRVLLWQRRSPHTTPPHRVVASPSRDSPLVGLCGRLFERTPRPTRNGQKLLFEEAGTWALADISRHSREARTRRVAGCLPESTQHWHGSSARVQDVAGQAGGMRMASVDDDTKFGVGRRGLRTMLRTPCHRRSRDGRIRHRVATVRPSRR